MPRRPCIRSSHNFASFSTLRENANSSPTTQQVASANCTVRRQSGTKWWSPSREKKCRSSWPRLESMRHSITRCSSRTFTPACGPVSLQDCKRETSTSTGSMPSFSAASTGSTEKVVRTKPKRIRRIDLSDELLVVLKEHIRQQKEYWFSQGNPQPE